VTAYVTNFGNGTPGTVTPIDTATSTAGKAIKVGRTPDAIAITPSGKTAYVVLYSSGRSTVIPISTATGKAGQAIKVGSDPQAIAITP
jgi:DNA-binding beta-propeller fold protein YncE